MKTIKQEMQEYSQEELRLLGLGIMRDLEENYAILGDLKDKMYLLAFKITGDVYPYPEDQAAVQLTPEQIYYRARLIQEIRHVMSNKKVVTPEKKDE